MGTRSIKINKCKDQIVIEIELDEPEIIKAKSIIGKSEINDVEVEFKAANWIKLQPGFNSGNDFLAVIEPCADVITEIGLTSDENFPQARNNTIDKRKNLLGNEVKIFPNPAFDFITIQSNEAIRQMIVMNGDGNTVMQKYLDGESTEYKFNLQTLSSGIYFLQIVTEKKVDNYKLIKL